MAKDLASGLVVPQASSSRRSAFNSQVDDQDLKNPRPEPNLQPRAMFWATSHQCTKNRSVEEAAQRLYFVLQATCQFVAFPRCALRTYDMRDASHKWPHAVPLSHSRPRRTTPTLRPQSRHHVRKPSTYCTRTGKWFWHSARTYERLLAAYPRLT